MPATALIVIPAQAGIDFSRPSPWPLWIPAFAGMTRKERQEVNKWLSCFATRLDRRVEVADQRLVAGARPRVELGQQDIIERARLTFRNGAL